MELPGSKRIDGIFDQFRRLTVEKQALYSIVLAKRLLRISTEAFINRSAFDLEKIEELVRVFYGQILSDEKNREVLNNSYEKSKSIYTFKRNELMNSQAIDAISIIETSFLILIDGNSDFGECMNSYIESIDLLVQDSINGNSSREDIELLIYEHQTMQTELKFLEDFIDFLREVKKVDRQIIEKVEDIFIFDLA